MSVAICHRCRRHKRVPLAMLCEISGKNIVLHAQSEYCPLKMFGTDQPQPGWDEAKPMVVPHRPPMPIPDDFDVEAERRRMQQGGCCGEPTRPG